MDRTKRPLLVAGIILLILFGLSDLAGAETNGMQTAEKETEVKSAFSDVEAGNKNLIFINYLANREIISGFPDGGFHPAEGLSRAQAATLLVKAAGLTPGEVKTSVFKDVPVPLGSNQHCRCQCCRLPERLS